MVVMKAKDVITVVPVTDKWTDVTLRRGVASGMELWAWRVRVLKGDLAAAKTDASVSWSSNDPGANYNVLARWDLEGAWPVKVSHPQIKSDSNDMGIQELIIRYDYPTRVV